MTTANIIATLRQGVPVTARLVREIITHLERLEWAERSLKAALETYGHGRGDVRLSSEESGWVCADLDAHADLRASVAWMLECDDAVTWVMADCPYPSDDNWNEVGDTYAAARAEVIRLMGQEAA